MQTVFIFQGHLTSADLVVTSWGPGHILTKVRFAHWGGLGNIQGLSLAVVSRVLPSKFFNIEMCLEIPINSRLQLHYLTPPGCTQITYHPTVEHSVGRHDSHGPLIVCGVHVDSCSICCQVVAAWSNDRHQGLCSKLVDVLLRQLRAITF